MSPKNKELKAYLELIEKRKIPLDVARAKIAFTKGWDAAMRKMQDHWCAVHGAADFKKWSKDLED